MTVLFIVSERASEQAYIRAIRSLLKSSNLTANTLISLCCLYIIFFSSSSSPAQHQHGCESINNAAKLLFCFALNDFYTHAFPYTITLCESHWSISIRNAWKCLIIFSLEIKVYYFVYFSLSCSFSFSPRLSVLSLMRMHHVLYFYIMLNEENWVKCIH